MIEFVALQPETYSYITDDDINIEKVIELKEMCSKKNS